MDKPLPSSAGKVQAALQARGLECQVVEFAQTTRTAREAAQAIGCQVEQIAKSLVFRGRQSGKPVLVIASGINRVDETGLAGLLGEPVEKPDAEYVLQQTGFVIGGVPPLGHTYSIRTVLDEDLLQHSEIWAAAGTPFTVFRLTPADLLAITGGQIARVKPPSG
jgi:prolyl-tRNA editing enzyme YbaK/EbsC (Cys-tRNA(Pro) deacylase)